MKKGIITLLCAGMIVLSGCYGKYACFNKLLAWNGTLGNKWLNSIVHFAMNVIPVYGIAIFVDWLVLNTVEFWTGSNPLAAGEKATMTLQRDENVIRALDAEGNVVAQRELDK